jgi:hypothetical protein
MTRRRTHLLLLLVLVAGAALRFWHLDWGTDPATGRFQALHPDEAELLRASAALGDGHPEITAYGPVALALPWITAPAVSLLTDAELFGPTEADRRSTFLWARGLSALAATLTILLTWALGRRLGGPTAGLLAAGFLAVAVLAIQQAHYYTVDGLVTLLTTAGLWLSVRGDRPGPRDLVELGLIAGLAAATRLNGGLLALPVALVALRPDEAVPFDARRAARRLLIAGAAALALFLGLQPHLLVDPATLLDPTRPGSAAASAAIATGEIRRIWTLYDSAQTPILFHLTSLLYHAIGPGLQIAGLAGLGWLAIRRRRDDRVLLVFAVGFLLVIGRLEAKNTRYMLPLIPLLCVAAGVWLRHLLNGPPWRVATVVGLAVIGLTSTLYSLAYVGLYGRVDNRLRLLHALPAHIEPGARLGYAHSGVHVAGLGLAAATYDWTPDPVGHVFNLHPFLLEEDEIAFLAHWLRDLDGLVVVDVARQRHVAATAARYPVLAGFYERLREGRLGFEVAIDVDDGPRLGSLSLVDRRAEPSFFGFDHPQVTLFRRAGDVSRQTDAWIAQVRRDTSGYDGQLRLAGRLLDAGDLDAAERVARRLEERWPQRHLPRLLRAELLHRRGDPEGAQRLWRSVHPESDAGSWAHEAEGLRFAGVTLRDLGALWIAERCRQAAARLGSLADTVHRDP